MKRVKGFTLIEVLLVIAILAILAGIVIVAVNPLQQLQNARNAQRRADVNTILNAVYQYTVDNNGTIPVTIPSSAGEICVGAVVSGCTVDLTVITTNEKYLTAFPKDPTGGTTVTTKYTIVKSANGRITVAAPASVTDGGLATAISVTR